MILTNQALISPKFAVCSQSTHLVSRGKCRVWNSTVTSIGRREEVVKMRMHEAPTCTQRQLVKGGWHDQHEQSRSPAAEFVAEMDRG